MKKFAADLHIHSALSPCAAKEMTPPAIVRAARERALAMVAVCDHNSARNAAAVLEAARGQVAALAGMEITTAEEAHVLGIFPDAAAAGAAGDEVCATLPEGGAGAEAFGEQLLMDADGRVLGKETRMLSAASALTLSDAVNLIHRHGGLAVAAHVNRPSFSVLSQLGMFPTDVRFDAVELFVPALALSLPNASPCPRVPASDSLPAEVPVIASSDSHFLADVGRCRTLFEMRAATFAELALALQGRGGRKCAYA